MLAPFCVDYLQQFEMVQVKGVSVSSEIQDQCVLWCSSGGDVIWDVV